MKHKRLLNAEKTTKQLMFLIDSENVFSSEHIKRLSFALCGATESAIKRGDTKSAIGLSKFNLTMLNCLLDFNEDEITIEMEQAMNIPIPVNKFGYFFGCCFKSFADVTKNIDDFEKSIENDQQAQAFVTALTACIQLSYDQALELEDLL